MSTLSPPVVHPTPFHLRTARLCLANQWETENGWTKPLYYSNSMEEYWALRNAVGVYDLTGLIHYRIAGADAASLLDYLTTSNIGAMADGTIRYVLWCDDRGAVVGDGVLYRFARDHFRLFSWQKSYQWLADSASGFDVVVEDVSHHFAGLSVQGPDARALLHAMGLKGTALLKPLALIEIEHQKIPLLVGRVSGCGGLGFEIFADVNDALFLWDEVMNHRTVLASPIGSEAHRFATVEAGHPRIGIDFLSADTTTRPHRAVTPFDLGYETRVDFNKPHFIGRQALEIKRSQTPHQVLCGITYDGAAAHSQCPIYANGTNVGATTSIVWSPLLARYVGFAWILSSALDEKTGLHIRGAIADELKVDQRDIPIQVVRRRFHRSAGYMETPAAIE